MVFTKIQPFSYFRFRVTFEFFSIKITHEIFCSATTEHTTRVDIYNHHPFHIVLVTINRQLDKVRTFKLIRLYTITFTKSALIFPVLQVRRRIETHFLVRRNDHIPFLSWFIPEHFRIAEIFQSVKRSQNRIFLVFCISTSIVFAISHTLNLSVFIAGRCVESNNGIFSVACAIVLVYHCTS